MILSADFRFCRPDYLNDHIWEVEPFRGDAAIFGVRTSYGCGRVHAHFPAFTIQWQKGHQPEPFLFPPVLTAFSKLSFLHMLSV